MGKRGIGRILWGLGSVFVEMCFFVEDVMVCGEKGFVLEM